VIHYISITPEGRHLKFLLIHCIVFTELILNKEIFLNNCCILIEIFSTKTSSQLLLCVYSFIVGCMIKDSYHSSKIQFADCILKMLCLYL